jgi:hypothetical protein
MLMAVGVPPPCRPIVIVGALPGQEVGGSAGPFVAHSSGTDDIDVAAAAPLAARVARLRQRQRRRPEAARATGCV